MKKIDKSIQKNHELISDPSFLVDQILSNFPANIFWKDARGVYLGCNKHTAKFLGLDKPEDIVGQTDENLAEKLNWSADVLDAIKKDHAEVIETGQPKLNVEFLPLKNSKGQAVEQFVSSVPLKSSKEETIGSIGFAIETTERQRLAQDSGMVLKHIVANMPGSVYWMNKAGVYLGCNNTCAELIGLSSHTQMLGKTIYDIAEELDWSKDIPDSFNQDDKEVLLTGKPILSKEEPPFLDAKGKLIVQLSNRVPLLDAENKVLGVLGLSIDITDRKSLEEAEAKNKGMRLLAASIAHETRTPLLSIKLGINSLKKSLLPLLDVYHLALKNNLVTKDIHPLEFEDLSTLLDDIEYETYAANMFIDMALINIKHASVDNVRKEKTLVEDCVDQALQRYPFSGSQGGLVRWDLAQIFAFNGDKFLMIHVLFNLIKNALYYIQKAGKGDILIWCDQGETVNTLHFKDTGLGMDPAVAKQVFETHFSQTPHGTGVGLSFCRLVMEAFGGNITCHSKAGEFTEFVLSFPVVGADE